MKHIRIYFLSAIFLGYYPVDAREVALTGHESSVSLGKALAIFEDKPGLLTYEALSQLPEQQFRYLEQENINLGLVDSTFWLFVDIRSAQEREYYLEIAHPILDDINLFYSRAGKPVVLHTGDVLPFDQRPVRATNFVLPVTLSQGRNRIWLRIHSSGTMMIPAKLWEPRAWQSNAEFETIFQMLYYGICIAIIVYSIFIFLLFREHIYIYYSIYLILILTVTLSLNGLGYRYLWSNQSLQQNLPIFVIPAAVIAALLFSYKYLYHHFERSRILKIFLGFALIEAIIPIGRIVLPYVTVARLLTPLTTISSLLMMGIGIRECLRKSKNAYFFLAAFTSLLAGAIINSLRVSGVIEGSSLAIWAFQIGSVLEMLLFSLGIGYMMSQLKIAKERAEIESLHAKIIALDAVSRFVPRQFLKILGKEDVSHLNIGDSRELALSILFSDIRGFTALSEAMSAEQNFRFINAYLKRISPPIQKNRGFIDKFIGDAIMALFTESPENSLKAALGMQDELQEYNEHRASSGYEPIRIGIGLHAGNLMLGTVGGSGRLDTTVIGDTVNLASRVEGLTKNYGVKIILTDSVYKKIEQPESYGLRELDSVVVKGKNHPIVLYEAFDADEPHIRERKSAALSTYYQGLFAWKSGDFSIALELFNECLEICPEDAVAQVYRQRCEKLKHKTPGLGWSGVVKLK